MSIEEKLIKLGYKYNHGKNYLFKTIVNYDKKLEATCFYNIETGDIEIIGATSLIKELKEELENENI